MTAYQLNSVISLLVMLASTFFIRQIMARQPGKRFMNLKQETVMLLAYIGIGITASLAVLSFFSGR